MTLRPSGSTIKPLSVYAPALENGIITSASVYDDVPVMFKVNETGSLAGWPKNYPAVYRGLTNIITAVQESVNTIAVRVLEDFGEKESFDFLTEKAGLDSLIGRRRLDDGTMISDIGSASLALGQQNYGVTVRELSAAYTMFANNGVVSETRSYIKVTDAAGNILLVNNYEGTRAVSSDTASLITLMLENVVAQGTAKTVTLDEYVNVAGKTGTTQDNFDKWFIGYTPYFLGGVWCGHEYPASLDGIAGNPCIKVWDDIMTILHDRFVSGAETPVEFDISRNIVKVKVCADSGKLQTTACRADPRGDRGVYCWFVAGQEPTEYCKSHVMVDYDIVGGGVAGPYCPAENKKQVGMILTERSFPVQIYVTDAQYVWKQLPSGVEPTMLWNVPFFANSLKDGEYCGISNTSSQFNRYCSLHYKKEEPETTAKPHINWFWPTG
jgi:penicillin-binding protein 1A